MVNQEALRPCSCCTCVALDRLFPGEGVQLALLGATSKANGENKAVTAGRPGTRRKAGSKQ